MNPSSTATGNASKRPLLMRAALGLLIAAAIVSLQLSPTRGLFSGDGLQTAKERIDALGYAGPLAFMGLCVVGIGLGLPRLGFAAIGGFAFGWLSGSVLAQVGTVVGCFLNFTWARYLGRDLALRRGGRAWQGLMGRVARRPMATNVVLRLIPIGNSLALNSFLGLCPISSRDFLVGTAVGTFPETVAFALFGAGAATGSVIAVALGTLLVLVLLAGTLLVARRVQITPESP